MKIIYSGLRVENYNPKRSPSFEYTNFYLTLKSLFSAEVIEYPFDNILKVGKRWFNKNLLDLILREKPDLFFAFMYTDELDVETLDAIKRKTKTIAWFADDHWRIWNYSRHYAPHFTWGATTWSMAPAIYARYGIKNIIRSQWACSPREREPFDFAQDKLFDVAQGKPLNKDINVSFVGQRTEKRANIIEELRRAGINIYVRGWGWPEGRVSEEEAVKIFSRSKINLNINDSPNLFKPKYLARLFLRRSMNRFVPSLNFLDNFQSWRGMSVPQIKARPFELSARGAFVISGYADDMDAYYEENEEMIFYRSSAELAQKIAYYLERGDEREKIAEAGYQRTLREHTYKKRFEEIFEKIGLR
ncbi:MAG: glycosyltransferase [Candidatus Liptonbacteria bacterium]|nr:glycosyltransferase [Candidatus Liptonbacteria bacterium]